MNSVSFFLHRSHSKRRGLLLLVAAAGLGALAFTGWRTRRGANPLTATAGVGQLVITATNERPSIRENTAETGAGSGSTATALSDGEKRSIAAQIHEAERWFTPHEAQWGCGEGQMASNPRQQISIQAGADGFGLRPWKGDWEVHFRPDGGTAGPAPAANQATVSWTRVPGEREWLRNDEGALEHGFTLDRDDDPSAPRRTSARIDTTLAVEAIPSGDGLIFRDAEGRAVLRYDHALASDAKGRSVPMTMQWTGTGRLDFMLDDSRAEYPVTIDPVLSTPGLELFADETGDALFFGSALSIDGGFLAVGHFSNQGIGTGQAYVFERRGDGGWDKVAKLASNDGDLALGFGVSVALQGGRLAVGASSYAPAGWPGGSGVDSPGAVYIFERQSDGSWPQMARATATDLNTSLHVGYSLSLSGDRLASGTSDRFPNPNEAAFVFARQPNGTWVQEAKLVASDWVVGDGFGKRVALQGSLLAVGSPDDDHSGVTNAGSVYLYERAPIGGVWNQVAKLVANDPVGSAFFGDTLSLSGFRLAIGGSWAANPAIHAGAVYVFEKPFNSPWAQSAKIVPAESAESDNFGGSLSQDGSSLLIGSGFGHNTPNPGRAYLYDRIAGGSWVLKDRLEAFDPVHSHQFGYEVVLKGDVVAIGSFGSASFPGIDGRVTLFTRGRGEWELTRSIGTTPPEPGVQRLEFGGALALHGDLLLAGAPTTFDQSRGGTNTGAAYLFQRHKEDPDGWDLRKVLIGSDTTSGHFFGSSVALNDDVMVVGAPQAGGTGAAYVFLRDQGGPGNWGQLKKLTSIAAGAKHGATVAVDRDVIAVGAPNEVGQRGKVRIYQRDTGGVGLWGVIKTLDDPSVGVLPDRFGAALCLDSDRLLVGAPGTQGTTVNGTSANVGRAYLFEKHLGGGYNFGLQDTMPQMLPAQGYSGRSDGLFGSAVALDRDMALIGEPGGADGAARAYVFERNSGNVDAWDQVKQLAPPAGAEGGAPSFGRAVALAQNVAAVATDNWSVYLYAQNNGGIDAWGRTSHLRDRQSSVDAEHFGTALAFDGQTLAIGEPGSLEYGGGGAIRVYEQRFDGWKQLKQVEGSDTGQDDAFGSSVAIHDGWLAVGAPYQANFTGAAYMFRRNGVSADQWGHWKKLVPADAQAGDHFGEAIAIDGQTVIVGAPEKTKVESPGGVMTPRLKAGAAYLFSRNQGGLPDSWNQTVKLTSTITGAAAANDVFGTSVAIDGPLAVVGMPADSADKGRAYVYAILGNGAWGLTENLQPATVLVGDSFGRSVAVSGETVLVGAPLDDVAGIGNDAGSAVLFKRDASDTFSEVASFTAPDAVSAARFGSCVALDGDLGAVGAPTDSEQGANAGAVYLLRRQTDGTWGVTVTLRPLVGAPGATFGGSLALQGSVLAIGAPGAVGSTGEVHVYERWALDGWHSMQILSSNDAETLEFFGNAVALDGRLLAIGSKADDDAGTKSGSVGLFALQGRPFDAWRRDWFGDAVVSDLTKEATIWGDLADADGDGLSNLEEAYFGLAPNHFDAPPPVQFSREPATGNFVARWSRSPYDLGIRARPQYSIDLKYWYVDGTDPTDNGRTLEFHDLGGSGYGTVEARLHGSDLPTAFLRLEIWRE